MEFTDTKTTSLLQQSPSDMWLKPDNNNTRSLKLSSFRIITTIYKDYLGKAFKATLLSTDTSTSKLSHNSTSKPKNRSKKPQQHPLTARPKPKTKPKKQQKYLIIRTLSKNCLENSPKFNKDELQKRLIQMKTLQFSGFLQLQTYFEDNKHIYLVIGGLSALGNNAINAIWELKSLKDVLKSSQHPKPKERSLSSKSQDSKNWQKPLHSRNSTKSKKGNGLTEAKTSQFFKGVLNTIKEFYKEYKHFGIRNLELENLYMIKMENDDIIGLIDISFFANFLTQRFRIISEADSEHETECQKCWMSEELDHLEHQTCYNILRLIYETIGFNKRHPEFQKYLRDPQNCTNKCLVSSVVHRLLRRASDNKGMTIYGLLNDPFFRINQPKSVSSKNYKKQSQSSVVKMLERTIGDLKQTMELKDSLLNDMQQALIAKDQRISELETILAQVKAQIREDSTEKNTEDVQRENKANQTQSQTKLTKITLNTTKKQNKETTLIENKDQEGDFETITSPLGFRILGRGKLFKGGAKSVETRDTKEESLKMKADSIKLSLKAIESDNLDEEDDEEFSIIEG